MRNVSIAGSPSSRIASKEIAPKEVKVNINSSPFQKVIEGRFSAAAQNAISSVITTHDRAIDRLARELAEAAGGHLTRAEANRQAEGILSDGKVDIVEWIRIKGLSYESLLEYYLYNRDGNDGIYENELARGKAGISTDLAPMVQKNIARDFLSRTFGGSLSRWGTLLADNVLTIDEFRSIYPEASTFELDEMDFNHDGRVETHEIVDYFLFSMLGPSLEYQWPSEAASGLTDTADPVDSPARPTDRKDD
jgi:hypothetical protein